MRYQILVPVLVLAMAASVVRAQTGKNTWGFVNARYDTRSSASIYTGYGWRGLFAMAGVLNTRTGQAEVLGGVGAAFSTGPNARHWLAVAKSETGTVSTVQSYWLPTLRTGAFTTRANVKWSVAYKGSAARKLSVAPLAMTMPVWRRVSGGVAMDLSSANGARTTVSAGFQLRLRLPRAAVNADVLRDVTPDGNGSRFRMFFASLF